MQLLHFSKLQLTIAVYALLYIAFEALASIPSTRSLIIQGNRPDSAGLELVLTQLLLILFLVGFTVSWRSELIAGLILVLWYVLVCCLEFWSTRYGAGGGVGPLLGLPGFIFGTLFVAAWFRKHRHGLA